MEILWKGTVSVKFRAIPQNFCTRKLGEFTVFYAVLDVWLGSEYASKHALHKKCKIFISYYLWGIYLAVFYEVP